LRRGREGRREGDITVPSGLVKASLRDTDRYYYWYYYYCYCYSLLDDWYGSGL